MVAAQYLLTESGSLNHFAHQRVIIWLAIIFQPAENQSGYSLLTSLKAFSFIKLLYMFCSFIVKVNSREYYLGNSQEFSKISNSFWSTQTGPSQVTGSVSEIIFFPSLICEHWISEVFDLYLYDFMHCTADTWLADCITALMFRCTGVRKNL